MKEHHTFHIQLLPRNMSYVDRFYPEANKTYTGTRNPKHKSYTLRNYFQRF